VTAIQEAVSKTPSDRHFAAERALGFARENPCALLVLALARHGAALPFYSTEDKLTLLRLYEAVPATSPLAAEAHFELAALFRQLIRYPDASRQEEVAYELAMKNGFFPLPPEGISSLDEQLLEKAVRWAANKPFLLVAIACSAPRSPQAEKAVALLQEPIGPRLREAIETALVPRLATETMTRTLLSHPSLAGIGALHDAAGGFALEQGRTAVALQDFEHALGCESRAVDLSFRRARVQMMFSLYSQIANASLGPSDPSLVARILDTLERARRVDPVFDGYYAPCARALVACHEKALALDSATTPIALAPGDGARWTLAASVYAGIGEHGLAASFHHEAALLEPQDPTPLLEEARERSLNGEETRARALYREILGKTWHERFANILATARASAN
ncbi:MAG TPA: hypothetical protein VFF73_36495, partial [Planctomycetota bacterium]|nr:hypothetical protein [Planctomycetota bacterium]